MKRTIFMIFLTLLLTITANATIKVMVIDTGVEVSHPAFSGYKITGDLEFDITDKIGHGTHVTSLILNGELEDGGVVVDPVCKNVEVISCNYYRGFRDLNLYQCLVKAKQLGVAVVNFSSSSYGFDMLEYELIKDLGDIKFVTAAGNEGNNMLKNTPFPAGYKILNRLPEHKKEPLNNVIPIGALTTNGTRWLLSNFGPKVVYEKGVSVLSADLNKRYTIRSGTSMAAALHTHKILKGLCQNQK